MLLLGKNHSTSRRSTAAMVIPEFCPACGSIRYKKNGHTRHGKQHHFCKNCERQCSAGAENLRISAERRAEIAHLLQERLSLRGICRAVEVSLTWLLHFMVENHIGAIKFFICHYNLEKAAALIIVSAPLLP